MTVLECRGCHGRLKNPSPTGYGPTCARKRGLGPKRRPRAARLPKPAPVPPSADTIPGQTELALYYMQPSLDSV